MLYLDANASEPLRPAARAAALVAMDRAGNPAAVHRAGRAARRILEDAREIIAGLLKARAQDIIFCSGATEANALAVHALGAGRPILIGATEHDSIRAAAPNAILIPVEPTGIILETTVAALLEQHPGALVCLMAANNETGVLNPIVEVARVCAAHGALLHVDAVQAAGRCPQDWLGAGATSIAISGHKCGGPLGAGALILAPNHAGDVTPLIQGGGQERGWRGGSPALPAIAGLAAALSEPYNSADIFKFRSAIEKTCIELGAIVLGQTAPRLPNTSCLAFPGLRADTQLIALDTAGIAVSAGAACSSGKIGASHVLSAMGLRAAADCAIRVSLPWNVTADAVPAFTNAYAAMLKRSLRGSTLTATESVIPL